MTVHVDELHSEVTPAGPAPGPGPGAGGSTEARSTPWSREFDALRLARRLAELTARTRAEGFDD